MKQFKNGIFQFTKFEFDKKIPLHLLYFENVVIRTVMGKKKKAYTKSLKKKSPILKFSISLFKDTLIQFLVPSREIHEVFVPSLS